MLEDGHCYSIVSMDPQRRMLLGWDYNDVRELGPAVKRHYVWFPYTAFVFHYRRVPNGFLFGGVHDYGLQVVMKNSPFEKLTDSCEGSPTESANGLCCTDHILDNYIFPNPRMLIGSVLNAWWSMDHTFNFNEKIWRKLDLQQVLNLRKSFSTEFFVPYHIKHNLNLVSKPLGKLSVISLDEIRRKKLLSV
jgi:hypothetical protein